MQDCIALLGRAFNALNQAQEIHEISCLMGELGDQPSARTRQLQLMLETSFHVAHEIQDFLADHATGTSAPNDP